MSRHLRSVRITLVLSVDVDEWTTEFGGTAKGVPADVKSYVLNAVQQLAPAVDGIVVNVAVPTS